MTAKNELFIGSVLIIILTAFIVSSGCTSTQAQTPAQSNSPSTVIPSQTLSSTIALETSDTTHVAITTPVPTISPTITPMNDGITLTLNSAEKKTSLGNGIGKPGRVMLILDITIKNNDKKNDFTYTDSSFVISYKSNSDSLPAITSQYASNKGLINPLIRGIVPSGETDDGNILFGVNATSNSYKLSVVDSTGTVLGSIDNINVP